ncbi:MAG: DUF4296 domain-containing protein [Tenacibaculum sp.]|nr:DUF4296 domain-containing protein [Tenacibaculum sp.]
MKKIHYLIPVLLFIVSCTGNTIYKKPENLIPRDSMVLLLTDMHIASAAKQTKNKFSAKDVNYMHFVYEKYKIDSVRFESSNKYYTSIIDKYDKLLNEVKANLQEKGTVIQREINASDSIKKSQKKDLKKELDSLKNINKKDAKKVNQNTSEE